MFSAEPWTVPGCGSLNYLATGELCDGDTIYDRHQPHDLFMELAVDYDRPLHGAWRWQLYAGLAGEPALGQSGYPHRVSAMANPVAPITHHWLDSTHVAFGVVTVGMKQSALEGRAVGVQWTRTGRGSRRSLSGRAGLGGRAYLVSAHRSAGVASLSGTPAIRATTLAYGANHARDTVSGAVLETTTSAALLETSVMVADRHTVFGRGEVGATPAHHLHAHQYASSVFAIGRLQVGYVRHWRATKGLLPGIGGTVAMNLLPPELAPRYSGRVARGLGVFLSLRPARHAM